MSTLGFVKGVPAEMSGIVIDGRVGHIESNRMSLQNINHQFRIVTVLMTVKFPTLLLLAAKSEMIFCNEQAVGRNEA